MNLSLCKWQLKDMAEIMSINKDYICIQACFTYGLFFMPLYLLMNERNIHFNKNVAFKYLGLGQFTDLNLSLHKKLLNTAY